VDAIREHLLGRYQRAEQTVNNIDIVNFGADTCVIRNFGCDIMTALALTCVRLRLTHVSVSTVYVRVITTAGVCGNYCCVFADVGDIGYW